MTREFILFSRLGKTDPQFHSLHNAGRLDIVHECVVASLFLSHGLRRNVVFHAILNGPPNPPLHIQIEGATLYDVRTDIETWQAIFKKSFEALVKAKAENSGVYVLEEGGRYVADVELPENCVFVLGDHVGLPKKTEGFALRYGKKISLGKQPYLAASCITIINYLLDLSVKSCF